MILGLDISTSITGATVLDNSGNMVYNEAWHTRNKKKFQNHFEKVRYIKEKMLEVTSSYNIDKVFIEKPFMFFNAGGSSAKTMSSLNTFNGMVSWMCSDLIGIDPEYFTASQARKLVGVQISRGENSKEKSLKFLVDNEPNFVVEYTRFGNPRPGVYDKSDSYIIAKAGFVNERKTNTG